MVAWGSACPNNLQQIVQESQETWNCKVCLFFAGRLDLNKRKHFYIKYLLLSLCIWLLLIKPQIVVEQRKLEQKEDGDEYEKPASMRLSGPSYSLGSQTNQIFLSRQPSGRKRKGSCWGRTLMPSNCSAVLSYLLTIPQVTKALIRSVNNYTIFCMAFYQQPKSPSYKLIAWLNYEFLYKDLQLRKELWGILAQGIHSTDIYAETKLLCSELHWA